MMFSLHLINFLIFKIFLHLEIENLKLKNTFLKKKSEIDSCVPKMKLIEILSYEKTITQYKNYT